MRVLFDILHPAHVHVLKNLRSELIAHGHDVVVTSRHKDVATDLLDAYGIGHTPLSQQSQGVGLAGELITRTSKLTRLARRESVDAFVGLMGPSIVVAGRLLRRPAFVLYDTEVAVRTNRWVYPLATEVITPECYTGTVRGNHVTYAGYHELAYLHPRRFTPDVRRIEEFGLGRRPYVIVRLPSLDSSHDGAEKSTAARDWEAWIRETDASHDVRISAEGALPKSLETLRLRGPVTDIHHVIAFADVVVGESATMAAEAAVLGTPAVFIGATTRGYIDDIEHRYGLIRRFRPEEFAAAAAAANDMAARDRDHWSRERERLIDDHVDVSDWLATHLMSQLGGPA